MEASLKHLHAPGTYSSLVSNKPKKPRLTVNNSGQTSEGDAGPDDLTVLCWPSNADAAGPSWLEHGPVTPEDPALQTNAINNSLLSEIDTAFSQKDDAGPAITDKLASLINKKWSEKLADQKLKEKKEQ